jgi:membrane fusion protein, multidrug efflux system
MTAPPPPVTVSQPIVREVMEWHEYTGRTEAVKTVEVRARAKGYLHKVLFGDGSRINKGDLLFVIDPRPYQAELDKANADLTQAKARLELAKDDLERAAKLLAAQAISEEEYDARSKGLQGMQGAVASATASVEVARINLEFTRIRAPISGRIGRTLITEGNLVNGNGTQDTLLTYIVAIDPIYVYVDVDERMVLKYRHLGREGKRQSARDQNIPAELSLTDEDVPHQGYIDYVEPRADPTTGTVRARGVFPNADDHLSPGFFGRVRIPGSGRYQATLIAEHAIGIDQGQKFVMVVTDQNLAEYRPVQLGPIIDGLRVVSEGLQPGDWIIVNGLQRVLPGKPVQAKREAMPLPAGLPRVSAARPPPPRR